MDQFGENLLHVLGEEAVTLAALLKPAVIPVKRLNILRITSKDLRVMVTMALKVIAYRCKPVKS